MPYVPIGETETEKGMPGYPGHRTGENAKRRRQKMAASRGRQLAETIHTRIEELKKVCEGIDEGTASRAPEGRWSPKQVLSHVLGPEGPGITEGLQSVLDLPCYVLILPIVADESSRSRVFRLAEHRSPEHIVCPHMLLANARFVYLRVSSLSV